MSKYNNSNNGGRGKKSLYETKVVRIPIDLIPLVDQILEYYLDNGYTLPEVIVGNKLPEKNLNPDILDKINRIKESINNGDSGYKKNSASKLINEVVNL